jgi:predicted tellurium resistance membrane protein TerC
MSVELLSDPDTYVSLLTLTAMEVVLGIDNIVFISLLTGKLPRSEQAKARRLGLSLALIFRLGLLAALSWIMRLTTPLFTAFGLGFSGRHLILLAGGLFLVAKSTHEIYEKVEREPSATALGRDGRASFGLIVLQLVALDLVFSLDSVITAIGMAQALGVMMVAVVLAVLLMLVFAGALGDFVHRHPSMKILALSFLLLIGVMLVAEGLGQHVSKAYIYFAMGFSLVVELLNIRLRKRGRTAAG